MFHNRNIAVRRHCEYRNKSALVELAGFIQREPSDPPAAMREESETGELTS